MEEVNRKHGALNGMHGMLASKWAFRLLLCLNALATLIVLWSSRGTILSDTWSYLGLAEGIRHGEYSMWWRLPGEYPDTFRTPGYPLFIALFLHVFASWRSVLVVQFFLYVLALWLALRTLRLLDGRPATRGLFLLLLLPLVNVPFYIGQLYADIPVLVAIGAVVWLVVRAPKWTWSTAVAVGLLMGFVFQCKPIFLLFPFLFVPAAWCVERSWANVRAHLLMLAVFLGTVLPFGFWSLKHHGVFKVTPLEGAGSYMHIGYWSGKTPGYQDEFYLHNFNGTSWCVSRRRIPFRPTWRRTAGSGGRSRRNWMNIHRLNDPNFCW
jgi:hypothetical protein